MDLETGETDESINDIEKVLSAIGISIRTSSMEMRDFSEVLDELADKWVTLTSVEQNAVATAMAGTRLRENFNVLMENYDSYQEAIETATNSQGVAEEKYEAYMDSIEAHINKLKTAWESLVQTFEGSTFYKGLLTAATWLVENLPYIIRQVTTLLTLFKGYKLPTWFANLAYMFNPKNSVASGKYIGSAKLWTAQGQRDRRNIDQYQYYKKLSVANPNNEKFKAKMAEYEEKLPQGYKEQYLNQEVSPMVTQQQETNTTLRNIATNVQNLVSQNASSAVSNGVITPISGSEPASGVISTSNGLDPRVVKRFNDKDYSLRRDRLAALGKKGRASYKLNHAITTEEMQAASLAIDDSNREIGKYDKLISENLEKRDKYLASCNAQESNIVANQQKGNQLLLEEGNLRTQNVNKAKEEAAADTQSTNEGTKQVANQGQEAALRKQNAASAQAEANADVTSAGAQGTKVMAGAGAPVVGTGSKGNTGGVPATNATGKTGGFANGLKNAFKGGGATMGIMSGVTTAISAFATTEGDTGDKLLSSGIQAALVGGATAAGGPIAGMIASVFAPYISGWILEIVNAEEIARKARVEAANDLIEKTSEYTDDFVSGVDTFKTAVEDWTTEQYSQIQETIKAIKEVAFIKDDEETESDESEGGKEFRQIFADQLNKMLQTEKYNDSVESTTDALTELAEAGENAATIMQAFTAAQYIQQGQLLFRSQEIDRKEAEEDKQDALNRMKGAEEGSKEWQEAKDDYDLAVADIEDMNAQVREKYLNAAAVSSGVSSMTGVDVRNSSLGAVRQAILDEWVKTNPEIMLSDGTYLEKYINEIDAYIRANDDLSSLFNSGNLTVGDVFGSYNEAQRKKFADMLGVSDIAEAIELVSKGDKDTLSKIEDAIEGTGWDINEFRNQVFRADDSNIASFSSALGMTESAIQDNFDALKNLDLQTIYDGLEGLNKRYEDIANIFEDIADDGKIIQENMDSIVQKYPFLLQGSGGLSQDNILSNILDMVFDPTGEAGLAYGSVIVSNAQSKAGYWDLFKDQYYDKDKEKWGYTDENGNWVDLFYGMDEATTNQLLDSQATYDKLQDAGILENYMTDEGYEKWKETIVATTGELEYMSMLQEQITEMQKHDYEQQIDNLQSIIDAMDSVNEAREKELKLIKARDALENAKKEKKMVYRQGIGWTYESDQTAIKEAKDELDNLEQEKTQEDIQYSIDQIQRKLDFLENLDNEENLQQMQDIFNEWGERVTELLGGSGDEGYLYQIATYFSNDFQEQMKNAIIMGQQDESIKQFNKNREKAVNTAIDKYNALVAAEETYQNTGEGTKERKKAIEQYNLALKQYKDAVEAAKSAGASSDYLESKIGSGTFDDSAVQGMISGIEGFDGKIGWNDSAKLDSLQKKTEDMQYAFGAGNDMNGDIWGGASSNATMSNKYANENGDVFSTIFVRMNEEEDPYIDQGRWDRDYKKIDKSWVLIPGKDTDGTMTYKNSEWNKLTNYKAADGSAVDSIDEFVSTFDPYTILFNADYKDLLAYVDSNKKLRYSSLGRGYTKSNIQWENGQPGDSELVGGAIRNFASGTDSVPGGISLINELGTEGIITPSGTLTALPSKSGVVPADLTKNLWVLGEVAPNLIKNLDSLTANYPERSVTSSDDHSTTIGNLYATFQADENFDFDQFLTDVRSAINLNRHIK